MSYYRGVPKSSDTHNNYAVTHGYMIVILDSIIKGRYNIYYY